MTGRRAVGAALLVVSTTTMSGCDWKGPNSLPLPGTAGGGPDGYSVTVQLADVTTLDRNARVRVGDVTVGRIADIRLGPGFAEVTVDPDGEVRLPRNATARVGQRSLLGASHLELSAPPGEPAEGTLSDGDLVPVERSGGYPTTEQTLATLAAALGGSGLAQAAEVFGELDVAMTGRTDEVRAVAGRLSELLTGLGAQKEDIVVALESLERLSTELAIRSDEVEGGGADLGTALQVLAQRRQRLVEATRAVDTVTATAGRVVEASGGDLRAGLESLDPVLQGLADSGARSPSHCATLPPSRSRWTPTATRCAGTTPTARSSSTFGCRSWTPRCSSAHRSRGRWRCSTPSWAYPPHPVDQSDVAHRPAFPMAFRDDRGGAHGRRAVGADDLLLQD